MHPHLGRATTGLAAVLLASLLPSIPAAGAEPASVRPQAGATIGPITPIGSVIQLTEVTSQAASTKIFDKRTYVALYGHPDTSALGVLGEQGTAATIRRVKRMAARYRPYTSTTVVPALEIIATIAAGSAGKDGNYSNETPVRRLRPLVDAAQAAGVYVVLDLQPGRADFLTQAKQYQSLLLRPHVGLALDPEWRLRPHEKPLQQIGSVSAREVNQVADWLADLTRVAGLPQKMFLLHQFSNSMIRNRSRVDTSHPELAVAIQMDGQGSQPAKRGTYAAIRRDAPDGVVFGWKNFYDEDHPMLSPAATMRVKPRPKWVSYQ